MTRAGLAGAGSLLVFAVPQGYSQERRIQDENGIGRSKKTAGTIAPRGLGRRHGGGHGWLQYSHSTFAYAVGLAESIADGFAQSVADSFAQSVADGLAFTFADGLAQSVSNGFAVAESFAQPDACPDL